MSKNHCKFVNCPTWWEKTLKFTSQIGQNHRK